MTRCRLWLALGAAGYVALLAATALSARMPADIGFREVVSARQAVVSWVMPASGAWDLGVRPGDRLLSGASEVGANAVVSTADHGPVTIAPERWRQDGPAGLVLLAAGALVLLVAATALVRTRATPLACAVSIPFLLVGIGLSAAPATSGMRGWALALTFACVLALGPAFLWACQRVSLALGRPARGRRLNGALVAALAAAALAAYAVALLTGGSAYSAARGLEDACLVAGVVGGTVILLCQLPLLRTPSRPGAAGRLVLMLGTSIGLLLLTAVVVGPHLLGVPLTSPRTALAGLLLLPVSYAYAVRRHHALGQRSVWSRGVTRALGAVALSGSYLFLLSLLLPRLTAASPAALPAALAVFALGLSAPPVSRAASGAIDRLIFHDAYSAPQAVQQLVHDVGETTDVSEAIRQALQQVRTWLDLEWLAVLGRDGGAWTVLAEAALPAGQLPADLPVALGVADEEAKVSNGAYPILATPLAPLEADGSALLLAGPNANGEQLRPGDRDVLGVLSALLSAGLARQELVVTLQARVAELERRKRTIRRLSHRLAATQEDERRQIAVDLHDGPLQLQHAILRELDGAASADACRALANQAVADLKAACCALRPPVLDDLGLPRALVALARRMESRTHCPITVVTEDDLPCCLPSGAQLALLRIAQEALNNCAKHVRASAIAVVLRRDGDHVTLVVHDDGHGFESGRVTSRGDREHGLGLLQMREQASAWEGCVDVSSSAEEGTVVRAKPPLVVSGGGGR